MTCLVAVGMNYLKGAISVMLKYWKRISRSTDYNPRTSTKEYWLNVGEATCFFRFPQMRKEKLWKHWPCWAAKHADESWIVPISSKIFRVFSLVSFSPSYFLFYSQYFVSAVPHRCVIDTEAHIICCVKIKKLVCIRLHALYTCLNGSSVALWNATCSRVCKILEHSTTSHMA